MRQLEVQGTAQERGYTQGEAWRKEITEFAAIRKEILLKALGWSEKKTAKLAEAHLALLKKDKELWDEFAAISKSASISPTDLMILNNHTDLRDFNPSDFDDSIFECSCFAIRKKDGKVIAGQTWDMHGSATPYVAHLTVHEDNGIKKEIFTLVGCFSLTGVSTSGVGSFVNNLRSREVAVGLAWPALLRRILDQSDLPSIEAYIQSHLPSAGRNFLVASIKDARSIEVTGQHIAALPLMQQYTFHTNHYLSDLKSTEEASTRSRTTLDRYAYLEKIMPEVAQAQHVQAVADKIFGPASRGIISIPRSASDPHTSATCGGMLFDFGTGEGISFAGLYEDNDRINFRLC